MKRLFLALPLTDDAKAELEAAQAALSTSLPGAKWVSPDGMHLTLKFLGPVKYDLIEEGIVEAAQKAVKKLKIYKLSLNGLGAFPSDRRPRVVWARVADGGESERLAGLLDEALRPLGFPTEGREFTPHITLARLKTPIILDNPEIFNQLGKAVRRLEIPAEAVTLYESILSREGTKYFALAEFPLA
ncbi:MAG: RNA 2',3'-cyclic phosphodiesterase [Actinomycetota bacterium]